MLKEPIPRPVEPEMVSLEQLVPHDHLVRKIDAAIDFEFIRDEVKERYCPDNGRPAVDPVRLFKIILLGYLFGIPSERRLIKEIQVNLAYRWFLGMSLTEEVIDASTLSQNRRRRFKDNDVYERIFIRIIEQAIDKGFVSGNVLFTDSTHLKADANKRKYKSEQRQQSPGSYLNELNQAVAKERKDRGLKP